MLDGSSAQELTNIRLGSGKNGSSAYFNSHGKAKGRQQGLYTKNSGLYQRITEPTA
jgi:hypothetical protein